MDLRKVILGLTVVISFGCEPSEITINKMYLKEIIHTCYTGQFEYEDGLLISYKKLFGERVSTVTKFTYQSNILKTIETKIDNGLDYSIELSYGTNGLREREKRIFKQDNEIKNITTIDFFYDEKQNLKLKHISYTDPNILPSQTEFEWVNGNIVKRSYFYIDNHGRHYFASDKLLFDNNRNYTNQDLAFIYTEGLYDEAVLSKNNVISKPNNYEYNNSGYPIKYKYTINNIEYPVLMNYE